MFKDQGKFTSLTQETKHLRHDGDKDILEDDKKRLHQKYYWEKIKFCQQSTRQLTCWDNLQDRRIALRKSLQIKL